MKILFLFFFIMLINPLVAQQPVDSSVVKILKQAGVTDKQIEKIKKLSINPSAGYELSQIRKSTSTPKMYIPYIPVQHEPHYINVEINSFPYRNNYTIKRYGNNITIDKNY